MNKKSKLLLLIISFFFIKNANAGGFLGTTAGVNNHKITKFNSLTIGYNFDLKPISLSLSTNRINKRNKQGVKNNIDTIMIGLPINDFVPSLTFSNVNLNYKKYNKSFNKSDFVYSIGFNYFINQKISLGFFVIKNNKELQIKNAYLSTINYNF